MAEDRARLPRRWQALHIPEEARGAGPGEPQMTNEAAVMPRHGRIRPEHMPKSQGPPFHVIPEGTLPTSMGPVPPRQADWRLRSTGATAPAWGCSARGLFRVARAGPGDFGRYRLVSQASAGSGMTTIDLPLRARGRPRIDPAYYRPALTWPNALQLCLPDQLLFLKVAAEGRE